MAYSDFTTLTAVQKKFDLSIDETRTLFANVPEIQVSAHLQTTLQENIPLALAIATEKARSEMIIVPILIELRKLVDRQISLFSGVDFTVDEAKGLNGVCDYIISRSPHQLVVNAPILMLVEAKNEDMKRGLSQCLAEMVAAQLFNLREGNANQPVYGVVSTGSNWRFLTLEERTVLIDLPEYFINQIGKILGILLHLVS
jgi:hypothetical protein